MSRTSVARRFARLAVQALEARTVPANNLAVVASGIDDSAFVKTVTQGQTITIETLAPNAIVSVDTIKAALSITQGNRNEVIVTTAAANNGVNGHQAGNITWDASTAGDLDFTGIDSGKTLTFQTVNDPGSTGDIDLTAVGFHNTTGTEQISLKFDTSATNGSIGFHSDGTDTVTFDDASVLDLTVTAGTGSFSYDDAPNFPAVDAGGNISMSTGDVTLSPSGGIIAFGDITISANTVSLTPGCSLDAIGSLAITGTTSVDADTAGLFADNGSIMVTGGAITMTGSDLSALTAVTVTGDGDISLDSASLFGSADSSITSTGGAVILTGLDVNPGANLAVSGTDVQVSGTSLAPTGNLTVTASGSLTVDTFSALSGVDVSLSATDALSVSDTDLTATGEVNLTGAGVSLTNGTYAVTGSLFVTGQDPDPTVSLTDMIMSAGGNLAFTGAVDLGGTSVSLTGTGMNSVVAFSSTVDGSVDLSVSGETVSFGGDIGTTTPLGNVTLGRGLADLGAHDLSALTLSVGDGVVDPLGEATLGGSGTVTLTGDPIGGTTADLTVQQDGNLAPGGLGAIGALNVFGNLVFEGGDFAVDFGATSDLLEVIDNPATADVEGNVTIDSGRLGGGLGTGSLPANSGDVRLVNFTGTLTGQFDNAPLNTPVLAGTDAVEVTHYGPAARGLTVAPIPSAPGGVFNSVDPDDGTLVTAKLTGGGQLAGGTNADGQAFLIARNTTPTSVLTITTKANGSDTIFTFGGGILINGPLAAFTAPRIIIGDQLRATGPVKTATFLDLIAENSGGQNPVVDFGGSATSATTITARNILGSVKVAGTLTRLTATGALGAHVNDVGFENSTLSAAAIGTIKSKSISSFISSAGKLGTVTSTGDFFGGLTGTSLTKLSAGGTTGGSATVNVGSGAITAIVGTGSELNLDVTAGSIGSVTVAKGVLEAAANGWNVAGGITTLSAAAIDSLPLTAKFIGTLKAAGTPDIGGRIADSVFTLTGNDGSLALNGIKTLTAAGTVINSTFNVKAGNVGPVKVGRFIDSRLYLNYSPPASTGVGFNTGGAFGSTGFKLASFTTTAIPVAGSSSPFNWAYQGSEIAADTIGTVTLSGLSTDNGGVAFGIKEHHPGAVVVVKAADAGFPVGSIGKALQPSATGIGDFYFVRM
jgi:filamentous hemagglutinin